MIIIVEGIDRVGKTTLCNMIEEQTGIKVFKNESFYGKRLGAETEIELMNELVNFIDCVNCDIVLDRFHLSEYVYGVCNRGYNNLDVMEIDEALSKKDCILIYVRPTDLNVSSMMHGESLSSHNVLFECVYNTSKIKKFSCNYKSLYEAVNFVKRELRKKEDKNDA